MSEITQGQSAEARLGIGGIAVVLVGVGWVVLAAFWAVPAVLTIDGFVYRAMIDALARSGSLFVENGFEEYRSSALRLSFMRVVDGHLAPQYPGGWGIIAAPAYLAAGVRGVILLNAVASALTLPLIWLAARALFTDGRLAIHAALIWALATFAVDYAFGFWPHAFATFHVTAAVASVAMGWRGGQAAELRGAFVAGLVLGLGVNIRVDALIGAVPLAAWLLVAGRRPYAALGLLLAGLVPGLAAAAAINFVKFGVPSPLTYGARRGATSIGYYASLVPLAAAGAVVTLALGLERVRRVVFKPRVLGAGAFVALMLLLVLSPTREVVMRIAAGFWVLIVDFQALRPPSGGVTVEPDGTIRAFGLVKKALLQSLPFAPVAIVLLPALRRRHDRGAIAFCALFVGLVIVPFAYGSWHGGMANNMRYLLNLLPVLAILSAAALREIAAISAGRALAGPVAVLGVGGAAILYAVHREYPFEFAFQHTLPIAVAGATAAVASLVVLARDPLRGTLATALRGLVAFGLTIAFISGWVFDVQISRQLRARNAEIEALTADVPRDALLITIAPAAAGFRVNRPPALTAKTELTGRAIYPALRDLVERAQAEGRPVFAQSRHVAEAMVKDGLARDFVPRYGINETFDLYQMEPPSASGAQPD